MKTSKLEKKTDAIKKAIEIEFCKYLAISSQSVTDAMNAKACPLGSEAHFESTVKAVLKALKNIK